VLRLLPIVSTSLTRLLAYFPTKEGYLAMTVRFGTFAPQGWRMDLDDIADPAAKFEAMIRVAQVADEGGWDSVWLYDHFHTTPVATMEATFECWTSTTAIARATKNVNVGQMVGCNGYRNPALYAKIASTVDVASNGRLYAGLGAGWYEQEWKAYGYEWPELRVRMGQFREAAEIVHRMWTEDKPTFHGKYYHIDAPINEPKGIRKPHIPLWIGGGGEQVTLKMVAQWGDACNVGGGNPALIREKLAILRRHCDDLGRDYNTITKSTSLNVHILDEGDDAEALTRRWRLDKSLDEYSKAAIVGSPDYIRTRVQAVADAGADYIIIYLPGVAYDQTPMRRFAKEVLPHFA